MISAELKTTEKAKKNNIVSRYHGNVVSHCVELVCVNS